MWSPKILLNPLLGLLLSLIVATASAQGPYSVPIHSTLRFPFTLFATHPSPFHVVVNDDGTPVATSDKRASTVFRLTEGKLTVVESGRTAILGPVPLPWPPVLAPLRFNEKPPPAIIAPFVAETNITDPHKETLVLYALDGRKLKNQLSFPIKWSMWKVIWFVFNSSCAQDSDRSKEPYFCEASG